MTRPAVAHTPADRRCTPEPGIPRAARHAVSPVHGHVLGAVSALELYDEALAAHQSRLPPVELLVRAADGPPVALALDRWCGAADAADRVALDRLRAVLPAHAQVLDLGCGPGRHAAYLHDAGLAVLGVDTSLAAVALTRRTGAPALHADALGRLPGRGAWAGVLLLDGNVGMGGNPRRLLSQAAGLLTPGGRVLVELDPDGVTDCRWLQLSDDERVSAPFPWARLAAGDGLEQAAAGSGLAVSCCWLRHGRQFALLAPF